MSKRKRPSVKTMILFAIAWMCLVGLILLETLGWPPKTPAHWLLLIIFGPPAYILLEGIGEEIFGKLFDRVTRRLGEQRLTRLNKILALIIAIPVAVLLF